MACATLASYLRSHCLTQGHKNLSLNFSSKSFMILGLSFRSTVHSLELVFLYGVRFGVQIHHLPVDFQLSQTIC